MLCAGLVIAAGLGISSCKKDLPIKSNDKVFKVALFKQGLQEQLAGARGYQFIINQDGRWVDSAVYGIGGFDRAGNTFPAMVESEVNIASVTKTFTAVAALKLLAQNGLTIEDQIADWLPEKWSKNSAITTLKFRELLTHSSGIYEGGTSWSSLKNVVGGPLDGPKIDTYANANLALFRAMIPKLADKNTFSIKENELSADAFDQWMQDEYVKRMNSLVFNPAGTSAVCVPDPKKTTNMLMNEAPESLAGYTEGDWTPFSGGGGFFMSTVQMARMMAYLVHSDAVIDDATRAIMDTQRPGKYRIGWNRIFAVTGGTALAHGGGLTRPANGMDVSLQTMIVKLPNKVELALSINSMPKGVPRPINTIVQTAYNNAWVTE
ncbi:CubicO group peptidase (beta-lactamase class C family) [Chitinophaga japonensis]|uniref:CubicO group peptidase (Beta-lactamase class C family) n=2 Tax=Chitinophaga japonensis TaxID=104662 RepID=A0A562SYL1_CHIJA|nr:CubicO group peptidase (beta-lactamase class C family) [Chitinophaga japonensis]